MLYCPYLKYQIWCILTFSSDFEVIGNDDRYQYSYFSINLWEQTLNHVDDGESDLSELTQMHEYASFPIGPYSWKNLHNIVCKSSFPQIVDKETPASMTLHLNVDS